MRIIYITEDLSLKKIINLLFSESRNSFKKLWIYCRYKSFYQDLLKECLSTGNYTPSETLLVCNVLLANYIKKEYYLTNVTVEYPKLPDHWKRNEDITIKYSNENIYYTEEQFISTSETVFLNGLKQRRDIEYTVLYGEDPEKAIGIVFKFPILPEDWVEIKGKIIN